MKIRLLLFILLHSIIRSLWKYFQSKISLLNYRSGIYYVQYTSEKGNIYTKRVVKQ